MRWPRLAWIAFAVVLAGALPAAAQEEAARAIIEQAIRAHGGEERLARVRADRVKSRGTLFLHKRAVPFTAETVVQLPSQFKSIVELTEDGTTHTVVHLINGDKPPVVLLDGTPEKKIDPAALAEMRDAMLLDRIIRLVPLLRDRTFDLTPLEPTKINDRPAVGVKVVSRNRREFRLFFDKETNLLVKTEHMLGDGSGKQVREERYFGTFKEADGCLRPFRIMAYRDGRKLLEADVTEVKRLDRLDESEFTRP
jgi:hypothetical protein